MNAARTALPSTIPSLSATLGLYLAFLVAGGGVFLVLRTSAAASASAGTPSASVSPAESASTPNIAPATDVVFHVLVTLAAVITLGHFLGAAARWVGQPPVIGEVLAGILLGPSLLGAIWPDAMHALVPSAEFDPRGHVPAALKAIAQLGIILYMFLVGLDLNAAHLRKNARATVVVSHAGIAVPFLLGATLALALYPEYAGQASSLASFALFVGAAMAVTAFPVLARILSDRGLDKSELGVMALGCAAADDVTAWCLLALVVGVAQAHVGGAIVAGLGAIVFTAVMFLAARPVAVWLAGKIDRADGPLPAAAIPITLVALIISAATTEAIGVHAIYGAFLMGVVIPHDSRLAREFAARSRDLVAVLLLPAFFADTGLRTCIGLVDGVAAWTTLLAIVAVATLGKLGGVALAGRLTGLNTRTAIILGLLMNTRGLMELIVLNIGLDLGVISPTFFAMMVLMALATTAMTGPLIDRISQPSSGRRGIS